MAARIFNRTNAEDVFTKASRNEVGSDVDAEGAKNGDEQPAPESATDDGHEDSADDVDPADDDVEIDSSGPTPRASHRTRLLYVLAIVASLIFVVSLGISGFFGWKVHQTNDTDRAARAALAAAQAFTVNLTSIDTSKVDQNFNDVVNASTGEFKDAYTQSATQLRQILIDNKALSKGTVIDSAVKAASKDRVEVLLFVDQWITNSLDPKPRLDRSRVALTMKLVNGRWLAEKVDLK